MCVWTFEAIFFLFIIDTCQNIWHVQIIIWHVVFYVHIVLIKCRKLLYVIVRCLEKRIGAIKICIYQFWYSNFNIILYYIIYIYAQQYLLFLVREFGVTLNDNLTKSQNYFAKRQALSNLSLIICFVKYNVCRPIYYGSKALLIITHFFFW